MAYLVKPFTKAELVPAIEIAVSRFAEVTALQAEIGDLRERLEMRKLLDRAKGVLQAGRGISEPEAFRWIQKTSMDPAHDDAGASAGRSWTIRRPRQSTRRNPACGQAAADSARLPDGRPAPHGQPAPDGQ